MKNNKLLFLLPIALSVCFSACGNNPGPNPGPGPTPEEKYNVDDGHKTKLVGFNFGGGIGQEWIKNAAERFAKTYKDKSYAEGKKGVYIPDPRADWYSHSDTMSGSQEVFFFDERASDITELAQKGLLLNLDSIVKDETRVGGSLESKIFPSMKDGLQIGGHYYGLPHYEYFGGLSYNRKVFDANLAYFADESTSNKRKFPSEFGDRYFVSTLDAKKSCGPDGEFDTEDDGLPATAEDFLVLCDFLKNSAGLPPIVIAGQYTNYSDLFVGALWSNFAGSEQMKNYFNCTGEIEVVKRDASGNFMFTNENIFPGITNIKKPVTEKVTMSADGTQGHYGNDMAAKYYAIAMLSILRDKGFFNADSYIGTRNQYDAQKSFVYTTEDGALSKSYDRAAMLLDGSYWYSESREFGVLNTYEKLSKLSSKDLDVRFMSLPSRFDVSSSSSTDFEGRDPCLVDMGHSFAFINGNVENDPELKTAALDFMAFLYSEAELIEFSKLTGMGRMIHYDMSDKDKTESSNFGNHLFTLRNKNTNNVLGLSGTTNTFKQAKKDIKLCLGSAPFLGTDLKTIWAKITTKDNPSSIFNDLSITAKAWVYGDK